MKVIFTLNTKPRGTVVNTLALYLGGNGFKPLPRDRLF
jgi:hypothetical protein